MKHEAFRQVFYQRLTDHYKQGELQALYHWCVEEIHGWSRAEAYLHAADELDGSQLEEWDSVIDRLQRQEPVQYIFGSVSFFGLELQVDEHVLIPRPETEELVTLVLKKEGIGDLDVLDIGTGSGCIALALKSQRPQWAIRACDVSEPALAVARQNAALLNLPVDFEEADVLKGGACFEKGEIWVSNPPYIPQDQKAHMEKRVLSYEPHLALFEEEQLQFFKVILQRSIDAGVKRVYFETHAKEKEALNAMVASIHRDARAEFYNDIDGRARFLVVHLK